MEPSNDIILILRPLNCFGIVTAELRYAMTTGRYVTAGRRVKSDSPEASTRSLQPLTGLCDELQSTFLYNHFANLKLFKHEADFWQTKDAGVRNHVKRMADIRLVKAITLADERDIPILYTADKKSSLRMSERLRLDSRQDVVPVMNFSRHAEGINYRLQLRIGKELIDPLSEHRLIVLAYEPALFVLDGNIYSFGNGFSAQLLLPFATKSVVEIPRRTENDYFRRFIMKHVAKAEINAEGFDIIDHVVPLQPCLHVEETVNGGWVISLLFRYDTTEYSTESNSRGRVSLTEKNDSFCFTRQLRDSKAEQQYLRVLQETDARVTVRGNLLFTSLQEMVEWLRQHAPTLRQQGFDVVQPSDHIYYIGPLSVEQTDTWQGDWLQTDVTVVIDGGRLRIPFLDLRDTILRGEQEYMLPTGERLLIPHEWLERYGDVLLVGHPKGQGVQRHRSQIKGLAAATDEQDSKAAETDNQEWQNVKAPVLGRGNDGKSLRPYQLVGFRWLWQNLQAQTGCCLSDEMGLGKTLQTIALLLQYKQAAKTDEERHKPVPGMLFSEEEMQGFATAEQSSDPSQIKLPFRTSLVVAPASVVHNWQNELARFAPSLLTLNYTGDTSARRDKRYALTRWDVVLTTYRTLVNDIGYLARQQFGIVVFDESQNFKTAASQVHQAVTQLDALHRIALSGTPVENNLDELWSLMDVLNPQLLGDARSFRHNFINPIAQQMETTRSELLRRLIAPYFLKRTKEEVVADLPELQEEVVVCPMTEQQASTYAEELSRARNEWLNPEVEPRNRQINMLAALQRLRQTANGEGKMRVVFDQLENLRQTKHKVLIFSEYVSLLERVGSEMQSRQWTYALLTGQTVQREQVIKRFQQSADCQFFLISLKAGGVGLNLTEADYVFLLDPWWNRAAEDQAIARAHRIGQHRPVFVYRFVSAHTLEEQILTLQDRKQSLIDSVMPFISLHPAK